MQWCFFTDLYIGWPRLVHDARVLAYTDFYYRDEEEIGWPRLVHDARVLAYSDFYYRDEQEILFGNKTVQIEAHGPEIPVVLLCKPAYLMKQ